MIEAKDVKEFVQEKWSLSTVKEERDYITNGNFESGELSPFTGNAVVVVEGTTDINSGIVPAHSSTHSVRLQILSEGSYLGANLECTITGGVAKSVLDYCGFYLYSGFNVEVILTFSDETTSSKYFTSSGGWTYIDLLTVIKNYCTGELLFPAGKTLTSIELVGSNVAAFAYVDDFIIRTSGDLFFTLDEYDPKHPSYQILFTNRPQANIFVAPNVAKIEQEIAIELHVKPPQFKPETLETYRDTFIDIKEEIDRIFETFRFDSIALGATINLSGWVDSKLPHGLLLAKEPLEFVSRFVVEVVYYRAKDSSVVDMRVSRISVLNNDLLGLINFKDGDRNRWVEIEIPKGPIVKQQLKGAQHDLEIESHDYASIHKAFYDTAITTGFYPVNSDESRTVFSTSGTQFIVYMVDMKGKVSQFKYTNVRVKDISLGKSNTTGLDATVWVIRLQADIRTYVAPSSS